MEKDTIDSSKGEKKKPPKMTFKFLNLCLKHMITNLCKRKVLKLKSHNECHTFILRNFNTPLPPIDKFFRPKLNEELVQLTDNMNMNPAGI